MKEFLIILSIILVSIPSFAQKLIEVESEYIYVVPENMTIEQAKLTALDRARIQAIADEFGTLVSQSNTIFVENINGSSGINFQSLGTSDVKGEWVETVGEPVFEIAFEQNMLIVKVKVKGRIREIISSEIPLKVQVLCNGTSSKHERYEFKNGDDMFLRFQSPVDGFVAIYLIDYSEQTVFCMLPYSQSPDAVQKIERDKAYIFFSVKEAQPETRDIVDEYILTCNGNIERNDIFVVFSPEEFVKANVSKTELSQPGVLSFNEFNQWLAKTRKQNDKIQLYSKSLTIKN